MYNAKHQKEEKSVLRSNIFEIFGLIFLKFNGVQYKILLSKNNIYIFDMKGSFYGTDSFF